MRIHQNATLSSDPVNALDAATKQYVDNRIGSTGAAVFITDIQPTSTGIVGSKTYAAGTVPANSVLSTAAGDTSNIRVYFIAEGNATFYSPTVTINGVTGTMSENTYDKRFFSGYADIVMPATGEVTANSNTGSSHTVTFTRAGAGPAVTALTIGSYPGSQTAIKSGDVVSFSGVVENSATYVEVVSGGASGAISAGTLGAADSGGAGYKTFSGTFTGSGATGTQTIAARGRNSLGTYGSNFTSTNNILMDQTYPVVAVPTISYPASQTALKGSESATVTSTVTNADVVTYTSSADLSVSTPNEYAASKTVTRVSGNYVVGTNNYTITATRNANGATTVRNAAVSIANTAATAAITIGGAPARLISSAAGQSYTITLTFNQSMSAAPSLTASSGTWSGAWSGSGTTWSRTLVIDDAAPKGAQTFSALSATGLAGVTASTITSGSAYTVGGFVRKTLTFAAFSQMAPIGTSVVNITKTNAKYAGVQLNLTRRADTSDAVASYTIVNSGGTYDPTGNYLFINDVAFAGSNTTGTLQVEIEEVV
jgi:hypothetical protein